MKQRHVKKMFLDLQEGKLSEEQRDEVERHLQVCADCQSYYQKMANVIDQADLSIFPQLEPDPFLPTRIKAGHTQLSAESQSSFWGVWQNSKIRWAVSTLMLALALSAGFFLGKGLHSTLSQDQETEIVSAYYDAFSQQTLADGWESVLASQEE